MILEQNGQWTHNTEMQYVGMGGGELAANWLAGQKWGFCISAERVLQKYLELETPWWGRWLRDAAD